MVCLQFTEDLAMGEIQKKLDFSALCLLADVASLICEGKLDLASSASDHDDEKKETVVKTGFGSTCVGWIVRKKRSPQARGLTFGVQNSSSDTVGAVVQEHKQENLTDVAENCKKRPNAFQSIKTHESDRVSKKPKKILADLIGQSELPTIFADKVLEMRVAMGEIEMKLHFSALRLLADVASLIYEGKLGLASSVFDRDDEKETVVKSAFGSTCVGWIVRKKRSPRARGPTLHAQKSSSDVVSAVVQTHPQENLRDAENCRKRPRAFQSTKAHEPDRVSKKPKKTQQINIANLVGPSELPAIFVDKVVEMNGAEVRLVVEKELSATDMNPSQSRLSIPKLQVLQGFLSNQEITTLDSKGGIKVSLIDPCLRVHHGLQLKKWCYGSKTFSYTLTGRWNAVAHPYFPNELKKGSRIQLWSFRMEDMLCFCLTKVNTPAE